MLLTKGFVGMAEASRRSLPEASKALAEPGLAGKGRRQNRSGRTKMPEQPGRFHSRASRTR